MAESNKMKEMPNKMKEMPVNKLMVQMGIPVSYTHLYCLWVKGKKHGI